MKDPCSLLDLMAARHGLAFRLDLPILGNCLITGDPDLLAAIKNHPNLEAGKGIRALRRILGDGSLITLDGEAHATRREIIAKHFRADQSQAVDALTVDVMRSLYEDLPDGDFSAYSLFHEASLLVILRFLFEDLTLKELEDLRSDTLLFLSAFSSAVVLFVRPLQIDHILFPWGRALNHRRNLEKSILKFSRRQNRASQIFAEMEEAGSTNETACAEILTLLMFGHDTAAAAMSWTTSLLACHPEVLEKTREDAAIRKRKQSSVQQISSLQSASLYSAEDFVHGSILESLRLRPVVIHLSRVAQERIELGEYALLPGEFVLPCQYVAHRNENIFKDATSFLPQRWIPDIAKQEETKLTSAFFPFGFTDRLCPGMPFALRQMQIQLQTVLEYSWAAKKDPEPRRQMVLGVPESGGTLVKVK